MKTTIGKTVDVYSILNKANFSKMNTSERKEITKARQPMLKYVEEYEKMHKDAVKNLQPDNFDEIARLVNEYNKMTIREKEIALKDPEYFDALNENARFNQSVNDCLNDYLNKEAELDFTPVKEDTFDKLIDSNKDNGWTFGIETLLKGILCAKEETETETEE